MRRVFSHECFYFYTFKKYKNKSQEQLNSETEELFKLIGGEKMETTTVATILKCDYESASKSLINLVDKIEKGLI